MNNYIVNSLISKAYNSIYESKEKTDFVLYRGVRDTSEITNTDNIIWATDDIEAAEMYTDGKGFVYEIGICNDKVKHISELKIADEYGDIDLYNIGKEERDILLKDGYNTVSFNTGSYDVYVLLNSDMITYIKKIS